jgi:hypothetical protein
MLLKIDQYHTPGPAVIGGALARLRAFDEKTGQLKATNYKLAEYLYDHYFYCLNSALRDNVGKVKTKRPLRSSATASTVVSGPLAEPIRILDNAGLIAFSSDNAVSPKLVAKTRKRPGGVRGGIYLTAFGRRVFRNWPNLKAIHGEKRRIEEVRIKNKELAALRAKNKKLQEENAQHRAAAKARSINA